MYSGKVASICKLNLHIKEYLVVHQEKSKIVSVKQSRNGYFSTGFIVIQLPTSKSNPSPKSLADTKHHKKICGNQILID